MFCQLILIISSHCSLRVLASVARDHASSKRCANASDHYIISKKLRNECTTQRPRKRAAGRNSRDQWKGLNHPLRVLAMGIQWRQYPRILTSNTQNLHRWVICCGELADMVPAGTRIAAKTGMLRGGIRKSRLCAEQLD